MPQLDTIFTFLIFLWTWLMLCLMMKKTTNIKTTLTPKNHQTMKTNKQMLTLPWT